MTRTDTIDKRRSRTSRRTLSALVGLAAFAILFAACSNSSSSPAASAGGSAAASGGSIEGKTFYWLQALKNHPVHQVVQKGFLAGCTAAGIKCELVATEESSVDANLALVGQMVAKGNIAGYSVWSGGSPLWIPEFQKVPGTPPMAVPHFVVPAGFYPGQVSVLAADPDLYAQEAAKSMCDKLKADGKDGAGSVALTQNGSNVTENEVSAVFSAKLPEYCPKLTVLFPVAEGADPPKATAVAVALMQAHPDMVGAMSTTGGGPTTWATAQKEAGKKIVAIGMDYTRVNLDLVKSGDVFAIVAQPLWDEAFQTAATLKKAALGEKVDARITMPAPVVTKDGTAEHGIDYYYKLLDDNGLFPPGS